MEKAGAGRGVKMTDEMYYRCYIDGDETGLEELMRKYGSPLTLYINGYLHDLHEAEDLMIEVFSYLFAKKPQIRDGGLKAYLYQSARHMALRHKGRRRFHFSLEELKEEPEAEELIEEVVKKKERNQILHACMDKLKADYREVLYLVFFEGMRHAEAGLVMGKTEKQIADLVYRGKNSLKKRLKEEGITDADY